MTRWDKYNQEVAGELSYMLRMFFPRRYKISLVKRLALFPLSLALLLWCFGVWFAVCSVKHGIAAYLSQQD